MMMHGLTNFKICEYRFPNRDLNPGAPKYESGMPSTGLERNVLIYRPQLLRNKRLQHCDVTLIAAMPIYKTIVVLLQAINYNNKTHSLPRRFNPRLVHVRSAVYKVALEGRICF